MIKTRTRPALAGHSRPQTKRRLFLSERRINRQRPDQSFWQLYQSHKEFLRQHQVETSVIDPLDEDRIQLEVENDLRDQIAHNISQGVLKSTADGEVEYSWRGMVYLWCQFLLDLVRL